MPVLRAILPCLALVLTLNAAAQDKRPVQCRFLCFGGTDNTAEVVTMSNKDEPITCPLSSTSISETFECFASDGTITFLTPGEREPAARAAIPPDVEAAILVFVKSGRGARGEDGALPWRVMVIEDSAENFPDGGVYVANLHSDVIRFVIGEHRGMLRPAGGNGYERPDERDDFNMAPVVFEFQRGDAWRTASESMLRFVPAMRYLIFGYTDPDSGRPRVRTYKDME